MPVRVLVGDPITTPPAYNFPLSVPLRSMQRLTRNLSRFLALSAPERRTLLSAMVLLPLFWISLRVLGLQRLQTRLQRRPIAVVNAPTTDELTRLGTLVNSAAHHTLGPANCLTRSLYFWWQLRHRGVNSQLRIGARLTRGVLKAHAWVEHAGIPINDRQDVAADFAPFAEPVSPGLFTPS